MISVLVCAGACVSACMHMLRIVSTDKILHSTDKILHFINTVQLLLILYKGVLSTEVPLLHQKSQEY